jgi:TRAP-type C4-dicarboxylate transport system permease small subunit
MRTAARKVIRNFEELVAGIGLVAVVAIIIYTIVNRYLLEKSAVWAPELAGMIFAWVVFLGASAAWKRKMHISINVVVRYLDPRTLAVIRLLADLILAVFLAYATYLAIKLTVSSHSRLSPVLRVPFSYVYASAALGFALMLLQQLATLIGMAGRGKTTRKPSS